MAAIVLPTTPGPVDYSARLLDFGSDMVPSLGGPFQRVSRVGSRHAIDFQMPPMRYLDAMAWIQDLKRGRVERVLMRVSQPDFVYPETSGSIGSSVAGGSVISINGITPIAANAFKKGQFFSVTHAGRSYLHSFNADMAIGVGGNTAGISISPMLRTSLSAADLVLLAAPVIEGVLAGDEFGWNVDVARTVGLSFSITEAE